MAFDLYGKMAGMGKSRAIQGIQLALFRFALWFVPRLPRRAILILARLLGTAAYHGSGKLRRIGRANLDLAFGRTLEGAARERILKQSFRTFALVMLDQLWFHWHTAQRIEKYVRFEPIIAAIAFIKKAQICVTAHLGNWEVLGLAMAAKGSPLASVAMPITHPEIDVLYNRLREQNGQKVIPRQGAIKALLRVLAEEGKLGLLLDQNTPPAEGGIFVDFFGVPAPSSPAGASLALRTGAEIGFGFCLPQPDGTYYVETARIIRPSLRTGEDIKSATQRLTREILEVIEEAIRKNPGHWLWTYKRWKFLPPGRGRAGYPFYAREMKPDEQG